MPLDTCRLGTDGGPCPKQRRVRPEPREGCRPTNPSAYSDRLEGEQSIRSGAIHDQANIVRTGECVEFHYSPTSGDSETRPLSKFSSDARWLSRVIQECG